MAVHPNGSINFPSFFQTGWGGGAHLGALTRMTGRVVTAPSVQIDERRWAAASREPWSNPAPIYSLHTSVARFLEILNMHCFHVCLVGTEFQPAGTSLQVADWW